MNEPLPPDAGAPAPSAAAPPAVVPPDGEAAVIVAPTPGSSPAPLRGRRRALEILAILACFALIAVVNAYLRNEEPGIRWYSGQPGQALESPAFDLTVTNVRLAQTVSHQGTELTTPGVFVVVEWTVDVKGTRARMADVELHTPGGLTIDPRSEFLYSAGPPATDPGYTTSATSVFQVDPDAAVGADFVIHFDRGFAYTYTGALRVEGVVDGSQETLPLVELTNSSTVVTP